MSSRWEQICEAVQSRLEAVEPTLKFGYGSAALDEHRAPTTVFFVTSGGQITPIHEIGGHVDPNDSDALKTQIFYGTQSIDVYCWANSRTDAEQLFHNCVVAVWEEAYGAAEFGDFSWLTEEERENSGLDIKGHVIRFTFKVHIPIIREIQPLHDISSVEHVVLAGDTEVTCASFEVYGFRHTYGEPDFLYSP
jgi:hypothetical protein